MTQTKNISHTRGGGWLEGQLLVATTQIGDGCFSRAVLYVCAHGKEGAIGLIINRQLPELKYRDVLRQLKIEPAVTFKDPKVYLGGPVEASRGFVIHSPDYKGTDTIALDDGISITASLQVLRDIAAGKGPEKSLLALGYAGWEPKQLESEIEANSWISVPATPELIFNTSDDAKWSLAAQSLGVDMFKLSGHVGHA